MPLHSLKNLAAKSEKNYFSTLKRRQSNDSFMQIPDSFFKKLTRGIHAFIVVVLLVVSSPLIKADTLAGRIVGVSGGDTLTLLGEGKSQH